MISNLPLLLINGEPTALPDVSAGDLEKFIPFMVTCSWGHDTAKDIQRPPWWPKDVEFSHPFVRPREVPNNWEERLRNLVRKCYEFHKNAFLLIFSAYLARYPRNRLRYVDNQDQTTSLYYKPSGRLLVTFRNENIFYNKQVPTATSELQVISTDIYLCDYCDSHFDNVDILKDHEKLCNKEVVPSDTCITGLHELLNALELQPVGESNITRKPHPINNEVKSKKKKSAANNNRGPLYPFSSLAYKRNVKSVQKDTSINRERIERYCTSTKNNKCLVSKGKTQPFPVRYRKPKSYWPRTHRFTRQRYKEILDLNAQLLFMKCQSVTVNVQRMSLESMEQYIKNLKKESEKKMQQLLDEKDIVYVDNMDCDQPVGAEMKMSDPLKKSDNDCEVIDLCSDDENVNENVNENCDPHAGVMCVMRGGAVLRLQPRLSPCWLSPAVQNRRHYPPPYYKHIQSYS